MSTARKPKNTLIKTQDMVGVFVGNSKNEYLGRIKDVVLERQAGNVSYVIVAIDGISTAKNDVCIIAWDALKYSLLKTFMY
jgi:sporulation protein YlmC with PRC-barrel domain